jgi:glutamyl-tRNA reductase
MQIILVGINHKTAPVQVREKLSCSTALVTEALQKLRAQYPACEFVLLSTCNRVECYAAVDTAAGPTPEELAQWLAAFRGVGFESIRDYLDIKINEDVATHLFTVAASLDSMVIGESQITAQVKESYKLACKYEATGKILNKLFHDAFRTAKDIITNTSIANRRVSVAGVAVDLARQLFSDLKAAYVVVTGAGQMGDQIAEKHNITGKPWDSLDDEIVKANIVVGAASAHQGYLFTKERIKSLMAQRRNRVLLIIDITVPRCFDPEIGRIENVYLYSIDDLARVASDNIQLRQGDIEQAVHIIHSSVSAFTDWFLTRDVGPLVGRVKAAFEQIRDIEMDKFFIGPRQNADCKQQMDASVGRIINKLCHCVINNIDLISKEHANAHDIISEEKNKNQ